MHRRGHRHGRYRSRTRRSVAPGEWAVRARVERFAEPALLLLLREGPAHGYDLLERLPELTGEDRVDMGNLYRFLRRLEHEGIVASEWRNDLAGPSKRTYELTDDGRRLLDGWATALEQAQGDISQFLDRYRSGRR
jgi:PadR family transcriptional regulator, regulatory protein PadR